MPKRRSSQSTRWRAGRAVAVPRPSTATKAPPRACQRVVKSPPGPVQTSGGSVGLSSMRWRTFRERWLAFSMGASSWVRSISRVVDRTRPAEACSFRSVNVSQTEGDR